MEGLTCDECGVIVSLVEAADGATEAEAQAKMEMHRLYKHPTNDDFLLAQYDITDFSEAARWAIVNDEWHAAIQGLSLLVDTALRLKGYVIDKQAGVVLD